MELLTELARQGILALLLAIVGYAFYKKDLALEEAYRERVADNQKLAAVIEATNAASKALETTSENRSRVIESVGEATRATADAIKSQATILSEVRTIADRNGHIASLMRDDFDVMKKERREDFDALKRELLIAIRKPARRRVTKGPSRP